MHRWIRACIFCFDFTRVLGIICKYVGITFTDRLKIWFIIIIIIIGTGKSKTDIMIIFVLRVYQIESILLNRGS